MSLERQLRFDPNSSAEAFRCVLGKVPTSVAVIATLRDGSPVGVTVGSFTSVSLSPPLVGFFPIHNHSYRGGADHTLYARTDDASRVGHAELEVLAHANMRQDVFNHFLSDSNVCHEVDGEEIRCLCQLRSDLMPQNSMSRALRS
jgi:Flavin reductase like domain